MRVLITGGTGHIAKTTIERLLQGGWDVRIIDLAPDLEITGAEYAQCNILDYDSLLKQTRGCEAVIHLAAIRGPGLATGSKIFEVNVGGTFNVFEAAAKAGIGCIVQASSINAIGAHFSTVQIEPRSFPIDEDQPIYTTDPYSFSKQTVEEIGAYYWRRDGISSVALRFPGVYSRELIESEIFNQKRARMFKLVEELVDMPIEEREARLEAVKNLVLKYRLERPLEFRADQVPLPKSSLYEDLLFDVYIHQRFDYWAYVDVRDAAQALEKSVTSDYTGSHPLFINDVHNSLGFDSRTLIRLFYPEVSRFTAEIGGSASLVSIERARALIGFEPEYSLEVEKGVNKLGA